MKRFPGRSDLHGNDLQVHTYFKSSKKEFKDSIVNQNENHEIDIYLS